MNTCRLQSECHVLFSDKNRETVGELYLLVYNRNTTAINIKVFSSISESWQHCWSTLWTTDKKFCQVPVYRSWKPVIFCHIWKRTRFVSQPTISGAFYLAFLILYSIGSNDVWKGTAWNLDVFLFSYLIFLSPSHVDSFYLSMSNLMHNTFAAPFFQ